MVLSELRVEQLGIIEAATVRFGAGLTVITGETGAGKTLLIDALELLCGGRADLALVREGATEARVEGRFVADPQCAPEGFCDGELVLARVVPSDGRSRGYVNGRLATAGELAALTAGLVDLHGQHSQQALLAPAAQRSILDGYAGEPALTARAEYRRARAEVAETDERILDLGGDEQTRAREVDLLRHQVREIDEAAIVDPDEDVRLTAEADLLGDAEAIRESLGTAHRALSGSAGDGLVAAVAALGDREPFAPLLDRLRGLQAEIADVASEVRDLGESISSDPGRLAVVQARRAVLRDLMRRYGPGLGDVIAFGAAARERLADVAGRDERIAALEAERAAAEGARDAAGAALTAARRAAAEPFASAVTERLRGLAMPAAEFGIEIGAGPPGEDGVDEVVCVLAPNPGEPARPVARAASG
ncbi:MAG: AAA family ATPase, partial [Actinomycetota bacterium]